MAIKSNPMRPAADRQLQYLKDMGVEFPEHCKFNLASDLISKASDIRDYLTYIAESEWDLYFDGDKSNFIIKAFWNYPRVSEIIEHMTQYNKDLKDLSKNYPHTDSNPSLPKDDLYINSKAVLYSLYHSEIDAENADDEVTVEELNFRKAVRTQILKPEPPAIKAQKNTGELSTPASGLRVFTSETESLWDKIKRLLGLA